MNDQIVYWWCTVCDRPIEKIEQRAEVEIDIEPRRFLPPPHLTAEPCGHTTDHADPLAKGGLVTTVGAGVGPLPSIDIAGRDQ